MTHELHLYPLDTTPLPAGAFTSLSEALDAAARLRAQSDPAADSVTLWCHGGTHLLTDPVVFQDTATCPLLLSAVPGEKPPVFDIGAHLSGWRTGTVNGRKALCTAVPERVIHAGGIDQLFVNGRRKTRAAFPKTLEGYPLAVDRLPAGEPKDAIVMAPEHFDPAWYDLPGIEAVAFQVWEESHLTIESCNAQTGLIQFRQRVRYPFNERTRIVWQNVREALLEPGEFYFDRLARQLWYLPEDGEDAETLDAVIPAKTPALLLAGPACETPLRNVTLRGLCIRHAGAGRPSPTAPAYDLGAGNLPAIANDFAQQDWREENKDRPVVTCAQADYHIPGAVVLTAARDCALEACTIEACGGYAVQLARGCRNLAVRRCECRDLGGGGIIVCGNGRTDSPECERTSRVEISDCVFADGGHVWLSSVGILLGHTYGNLVEHNAVRDFYYTGISVGWNWGYSDQVTRENRIGWNRIERLGKGVLCDMGGIYLLGVQPGTSVYGNWISDITCRHYGGWGIYTDEGSSGIIVERNLCCRCSREFAHQHFGRENIFRYNVGAFTGEAGFALSRGTDQTLGFPFLGPCHTHNVNLLSNVLLMKGKPFFHTADEFQAVFNEDQFYSEGNVFFDVESPDAPPPVFLLRQDQLLVNKPKTETLEAWRQNRGHDLTSVYADPGFTNPEQDDFSLRPDSILRSRRFPDPADIQRQAGPRPPANP